MKNVFIYFVVALFGGLIALFTFTRFVERPVNMVSQEPAADSQFTNFARSTSTVAVDFTDVAERTVQGVVHVKTVSEVTSSYNPIYEFFYGGPKSRTQLSFGSGVILSEDGYIVTNNHVVEGADEVEVVLDDKRTFKAEVVGLDPNTDLALLKIEGEGEKLVTVPFGNSDDVRLGQWVLAVGNPFNLTSTVTAGIISAKGRDINILRENRYRIESFLQTDAALNHGNSGGALVNADGELIGITSAIISRTGEYSGNSFAIPVEIVKKVVADLKEFGRVQRAILGVSIATVDAGLAEEYGLESIEGVYITEVNPYGAADEAGIKVGDVILGVDGVKVNSASELQERFSRYRPGNKVQVTIKRKEKSKQVEVILRNLEGGTEIVRNDDYIFGARFETLSKKEKEELNLSGGVKIISLKEGRLSRMGMKTGYVVFSVNGKKVSRVEELRMMDNSGEEIRSIEGLTPEGMQFSYRYH